MGSYSFPLDRAIRGLKYGRIVPLGGVLGGLAGQQWLARSPATGFVRAEPLVVAAVPSHVNRVRERGIDHAGVLAAGVHAALRSFEPLSLRSVVRRRRLTGTQAGKGIDARRRNVEGAFEVVGILDGCDVLLVDDVMTTGATAQECARRLLAAGARSVSLCLVARAVRRSRYV